MSIWKYFKRVSSEPVKRDEGLPEPTGPLSKSVPVKAIELANAEVKKVQEVKYGVPFVSKPQKLRSKLNIVDIY